MSRWRSGLPKTEAAGVPAGLPHCPAGALTGGDAAVSELRDEGNHDNPLFHDVLLMEADPLSTVRIVRTGNASVKGSMLLVGFPTFGLVGSISASYLTHTLGMKRIGYMMTDNLPPTVVMEEGLVEPPIRLYTTQTVCGLDGKCDQLVVLISDIQPPVESLLSIATATLDWAEENGVSNVVVLEGHPTKEDKDAANVVAMANRAAQGVFDTHGFQRANGLITGFTGAMLLASIDRKIPVFCLVTQAHKEFPDANAAAMLLEAANPLVPLLVIDTKPLRQKATQIEKVMRENLTTQKSSLKKLAEQTGGEMYR